MLRKRSGEADGTVEQQGEMGAVTRSTVDAPKKKRTVRYLLVQKPSNGGHPVIVNEFKSRQRVDGFLDSVRLLPGVSVDGFLIIKGKVIDLV